MLKKGEFMSKEKVNESLEAQILDEISHLDELEKDSDVYDAAVRNIVELHKPYLEQVKVEQQSTLRNRELALEETRAELEMLKTEKAAEERAKQQELDEARLELEKMKAEKAAEERAKQQELDEARLEFEKQKADREALEAFRARKAKERNDVETLKENHNQFMIKTIADCALHLADMTFLGNFLGKSFEFEETGTYGSLTTKEVIKRLPFLSKKK
jgi:hypothetical protein